MEQTLSAATDAVPEWTFGDRLRKARRHAGLEQGDVAAHLDIKVSRYSNWESGVSMPRGKEISGVVLGVAELTGVNAEWLLGLRARTGWFPARFTLSVPTPVLAAS